MLRACLLLILAAVLAGAQPLPFDVQALMRVARIGEPQLSPDGSQVAFTVQKVDLVLNTKPKHIFVVPLLGGDPKQITWEGDRNERPRWSPDSKRIAFVSDRGGSNQVWTMDVDGLNARQATRLSTEADGVLFSPDGKKLVFTSEVFPECGADEACNRTKLELERASKVKARLYNSLLFRHWSEWRGQRYRHILSMPVEGGPVVDLTPGDQSAPPFSLGGPDDYAVSPDGAELCYVLKPDPEPAVSTNSELFVVPIEGGEARKVTANPGADNSPQYSPDGLWLAFRTQLRPGFESDKWRLAVMDRATAQVTILTEALDRSVGGFTWAQDSRRLFFTVEDRGRVGVQMISVAGGSTRSIVSGPMQVDDPQLTRDGRYMIYAGQSGSRPVEIFRASASGGSPNALTGLNDSLLGNHLLANFEEFWVQGAGGAQVHSFLLKPPGFQADRRYPVLFLIHGGPQGAWGENWSYRWNPQVFASQGYVVVMPNPRGSTGYGQKFTDEISQDWGGKVYDDIVAVADHVAGLPYTDSSRMAAAGGSYGGYMVNWLLGRESRFKAFVSHAGVYDLPSMAAETEELWFPIWEFGGMPWEKPELYQQWSPSSYVKEFRTPTLVIHGELDYRVPVSQGIQLFTALQMQKVPSRLLLFPDEGHWILKPQNSVLWYRTFLDWIGERLKIQAVSGE